MSGITDQSAADARDMIDRKEMDAAEQEDLRREQPKHYTSPDTNQQGKAGGLEGQEPPGSSEQTKESKVDKLKDKLHMK